MHRKAEYCVMSLHELIRLVTAHTALRVVDLKPTFFHLRHSAPELLVMAFGGIMLLPFMPWLLRLSDLYLASRLSLEHSDVVYLKAVKP